LVARGEELIPGSPEQALAARGAREDGDDPLQEHGHRMPGGLQVDKGPDEGPDKTRAIASCRTSSGWAPLTARRWSKTKNGTPWMPLAGASSASWRVVSSSAGSFTRRVTSAALNPWGAAMSASTTGSEM